MSVVWERESNSLVGFEVEVVMNVAILWDISLCSLYVNRVFGATSVHIHTTWCYIPEGNVQHLGYFIAGL
jgi:hypothetical protein